MGLSVGVGARGNLVHPVQPPPLLPVFKIFALLEYFSVSLSHALDAGLSDSTPALGRGTGMQKIRWP